MAGFVQIIEFSTSRPEDVRALGERFRQERLAAADGTPPLRITMTADRDRPGVYVNIVEFESYDKAMENSRRPETSEFAAAMAQLCDGPPRFLNLDVTQTWQPAGDVRPATGVGGGIA